MADQHPDAGTPGSRSTGSHLAHDLRAIREARNVTLDEVQQETRMPGDILRRFEAGELVNDPHYNEVYLRNLLRAYAQAVNISPQEVSSAYEKAKAGTYDGGLRRQYLGGDAKPEEPKRVAPPTAKEEPRPQRKAPPSGPSGTAPAVAALSSKRPVTEPKQPDRSGDPMPKRRVQSATAASQPIENSWGLIIGGTVAALVVIGFIVWFLFRDAGPGPDMVAVPPSTTADTSAVAAAADTAATSATPTNLPAAPQFQTPIQLTVIAVAEPLEDFKVQVDDDVRRPYWINPGEEQTFTGQQRVIVSGEGGVGNYDGARLRLQGLEWTPREGQVFRFNEQRGQALLDSLNRVVNGGAAG